MPQPYASALLDLSFDAGDASNGNQFSHSGDEIIVAQNSHGSDPFDLTIVSASDPRTGRTGDIVHEIAAGEFALTQRFPIAGWRQSDGMLYIDVENVAILIAVVRLVNV